MCCLPSVLRWSGQGVDCVLALEWLHSESRLYLRHSLHSGPAAVQNFRSVHPCPRLFGEGVEHKECSLRCWLPTNATASASAGVGGVRARPVRRDSTRVRRFAAPTPVITLEANSASCARALAPCRLKFLAKLTRSLRSTASTAMAPGVWLVS